MIPKENDAYSVYSLSDPRTGEVRYVGCTLDVHRRLSDHMRRGKWNKEKIAWIKDLKSLGLHPVLNVLEDNLQETEILAREQDWIRQYLEQGSPLTNIVVIDPGKEKCNTLNHAVVVTQEQYERCKSRGKDVEFANFCGIRRKSHNGRSYFSIVDLMVALRIARKNPRQYWATLKGRLKNEDLEETLEEIVKLKLEAPDGKLRLTDCAKRECLVKLVLNIPARDIKPVQQWFVQMLIEKPEEVTRIFPN